MFIKFQEQLKNNSTLVKLLSEMQQEAGEL